MKAFLVFLLLAVVLCAGDTTGQCGVSCTYKITKQIVSSVLEISGTEMDDYDLGDNLPPWHEYLGEITSVVFSGGFQFVGDYALNGCNKLWSVVLCDTIASIGKNAFGNCTSLEHISIPNSVVNIYDYAFGSTGLKEITIPDSVRDIKEGAFYGCGMLEYALIGKSIVSIGDNAFNECNNLNWVAYFGNGTEISGSTQFGSNVKVFTTNGYEPAQFCGITVTKVTGGYEGDMTWLYLGDKLDHSELMIFGGDGEMPNYWILNDVYPPWYDIRRNVKKVIIAGGIQSIGSCVLIDFQSLTNLTIPDTLRSLGRYACFSCKNLEFITCPGDNCSIYSLGASSFYDAERLSEFKYFDEDVVYIGSSAFYQCTSFSDLYLFARKASISSSAFEGCTGMKKLSVLGHESTIGNDAFSKTSLEEVSFYGTKIGDKAFYGLTNLSKVDIKYSSLESIGESAFEGCTSLSALSIPEGVTEIKSCAFKGCTSLSSVKYTGSKDPKEGDEVFEGCDKLSKVCVKPEDCYASSSFCDKPIDFCEGGGPCKTTSSSFSDNSSTSSDTSGKVPSGVTPDDSSSSSDVSSVPPVVVVSGGSSAAVVKAAVGVVAASLILALL